MPTTLPTTAPARPVTDTEPISRPTTGDGDHDRFAHYVDKNESTRAYIEGTPIRALCGKVWVPSRDPTKYPICPTCQDIVDAVFGKDSDKAGKPST